VPRPRASLPGTGEHLLVQPFGHAEAGPCLCRFTLGSLPYDRRSRIGTVFGQSVEGQSSLCHSEIFTKLTGDHIFG
jgi:hypothetical protein